MLIFFFFLFSAFFTELLENSKRDLHEMFVRTYGLLYQQNSYIFNDLFKDVHDYYKGHDINLMDALDNFFSILLQKMFELINAQYTFDQNYLQCVTEHMDDLKPFGDVPQKLSVQVKRAFIAARTFVQGLAIGRDVVLAVSKVSFVYYLWLSYQAFNSMCLGLLWKKIKTYIHILYHSLTYELCSRPFQYKDHLSRYRIHIMKIRQSSDSLIFMMGILILVRQHLYIESAPSLLKLRLKEPPCLTCSVS